jgi:hypothetical protein
MYSDFVNILKNEEKSEELKKMKDIIFRLNIKDIHDKDYTTFNIEYLKNNSNSYFLIVSSNNKKLGTIVDCSTNIGNIFGYQKKELIGNHINILIPEIFHQKHDLVVKQRNEENKINFLEGLCQNSLYTPSLIQRDTFAISKSKFLIPIFFKIYLVNSEDNDLVYVVEIKRNAPLQKDLIKNVCDNTKYSILTDHNFLIQNFTSNCLYYLNIKHDDMNCNYSIINYIKQFNDEYFNAINNDHIKIKKTGFFENENKYYPENRAKKYFSKIERQK